MCHVAKGDAKRERVSEDEGDFATDADLLNHEAVGDAGKDRRLFGRPTERHKEGAVDGLARHPVHRLVGDRVKDRIEGVGEHVETEALPGGPDEGARGIADGSPLRFRGGRGDGIALAEGPALIHRQPATGLSVEKEDRQRVEDAGKRRLSVDVFLSQGEQAVSLVP